MTTYTAIGNSEVDTDSPITESLITRLRDNPLAQFEGAAGAPKIADAAFNTNSINGNKIVTGSITATQLAANSVAASEIAANAVNFSSEINTTAQNWSVLLNDADQYWTIPAGVFNGLYFSSRPASGSNENGWIRVQANLGTGGWQDVEAYNYLYTDLGGQAYLKFQIVSNGADVRIYHQHLAGNANNFTISGRRIIV